MPQSLKAMRWATGIAVTQAVAAYVGYCLTDKLLEVALAFAFLAAFALALAAGVSGFIDFALAALAAAALAASPAVPALLLLIPVTLAFGAEELRDENELDEPRAVLCLILLPGGLALLLGGPAWLVWRWYDRKMETAS